MLKRDILILPPYDNMIFSRYKCIFHINNNRLKRFSSLACVKKLILGKNRMFLKYTLLSMILCGAMHTAYATGANAPELNQPLSTTIFNAPYIESAALTERERINAQVAAYDALYSQYAIQSRNDLFTLKIPAYINIATYGIDYVKHHHPENDAVHSAKNRIICQSCDALSAELATKAAEGLTPVEFILFNFKLGLLQEYHPNGYSLEFDEETKRTLDAGTWKTTAFYDSQNVYELEAMNGPEPIITMLFPENEYVNNGDERLEYKFKPYIIYTPNGGFSTSRIVRNILRDDGKHRNLCALPIGTVSVENSPHGIYNRTSYDFLIHDLFHGRTCWKVLSQPNIQNFIGLIQPTIQNNLNDSGIKTFLFLLIHEDMYHIGYQTLSTSHNIFDILKQNLDSSKERLHHKNSLFDPFTEILERALGSDVEYRGTSNSSDLDKHITPSDTINQYSDVPNHYKGICKIRFRDRTHIPITTKMSTFKYAVKRTEELSSASNYYEFSEVLYIEHSPNNAAKPLEFIPEINDTDPIDTQFIEQILSSVGQKYLVITKEARATTRHGILKELHAALNIEFCPSHYAPEVVMNYSAELSLAEQLLNAFKARVQTLMPEAFATLVNTQTTEAIEATVDTTHIDILMQEIPLLSI